MLRNTLRGWVEHRLANEQVRLGLVRVLSRTAEAERITDYVENHASAEATLIRVSGVVRAIHAVTCRYERLPGANVMTPVERSGILRSVSNIDAWERDDNGSTFVGYAADIEVVTETPL